MKIDRRRFLAMVSTLGLGALVAELWPALADEFDHWNYLPIVRNEPTPSPTPWPTATPGEANVVHVYHSGATNWNYSTGYYGDYVNQDAVNEMVDGGIRSLTGAGSVAQAWQSLLSAVSTYSPGKKIAIKLNFNNNYSGCNASYSALDGLIHPVNAVVRGLAAAGVQLSDIWVFDASRPLPARVIGGCLYKNQIRFLDRLGSSDCAGVQVDVATWVSASPTAIVDFTNPGLANQRVPDILVDTTYVINMPVLRAHPIAGVTLGFKHHLGCIQKPADLHDLLRESGVLANPSSHPLLDLYKNPNIAGKTILTIGDGLYGSPQDNTGPPAKWVNTFRASLGTDAANSLLFSTDPVAVDCVMADLLRAERSWNAPDWSVYHLQLAAANGLGVFERGDPWDDDYTGIDYTRIELT